MLMYGLSYLWHGVALNDLDELRVPLALYLVLAGLVYLIIGLGMTIGIHQSIVHGLIGLQRGFPVKAMLSGGVIGFVVYLIVFILGVSFAKHGMMHVVVDLLWQMVEQAMGGLVVSFGIIYDLHRSFLETEK